MRAADGNPKAGKNANKERLAARFKTQYAIIAYEAPRLMQQIVHYYYLTTWPEVPVDKFNYVPFYTNTGMTCDLAFALQRELKNPSLVQPEGRPFEAPKWLRVI